MGKVRGLLLVLLAAMSTALLSTACDLSRESHNPTDSPEFLDPIREAQDAGVSVYWLGEQFQAKSLTFKVTPGSELIETTGTTPGVELTYAARVGAGSIVFDIESYLRESTEAEVAREKARSIRGQTSERIAIGGWEAEAYNLPAGARPVNALWLFVSLDETVVVAQAEAGSNGVPGQDVDPLIDLVVLKSVLAQNLRKFRE